MKILLAEDDFVTRKFMVNFYRFGACNFGYGFKQHIYRRAVAVYSGASLDFHLIDSVYFYQMHMHIPSGSKKQGTRQYSVSRLRKISNIKKTVMAQEQQQLNVKGQELVVAIGASTGGTEAIFDVVKNYGTDIPGIVVVQHMPPGFTKMYAKRLNDQCRIRAKEAQTGDRVLPGTLLLAPGGDMHCMQEWHPLLQKDPLPFPQPQ